MSPPLTQTLVRSVPAHQLELQGRATRPSRNNTTGIGMRIGIIGTGNVARALAPKFAAAGHEVFLASRDPGEKSGLPVPVTGYGELASADVIIAATPGTATLDVLRDVGADVLEGKVLIDCGNALNERYGLAYPGESLAAKIQAAYPGARIVKAFNTYGAPVMTDPSGLPARSSSFVSGNDAAAKSLAVDLHTALGWQRDDVIDLGPIESALAQEHYFPLFMTLYGVVGSPMFNIAVIR